MTLLVAFANRVGHESEFAFSRAFRKHHGVALSEYRKGAVVASRRSDS